MQKPALGRLLVGAFPVSFPYLIPVVPPPFAEVLDHELVGLGRGIGVQAMLEDEARTMGRPLRQRVQVRNFYAIGHLVSQGVGIGVVPAPVARRLESSMPLRIIALKDKWARQDMRICVRGRDELSLPARLLFQYLEARIDAMDVSLLNQ